MISPSTTGIIIIIIYFSLKVTEISSLLKEEKWYVF